MNEEALQYHINMRSGDVGRYVLLPGDPGRVPLIASFFDEAHEVAHNREHRTWTGTVDGVKVSVTSTGIGGPSTAIAVEELARIGADTFIRVGTSGLMQPDSMKNGDLVVVSGAVRDEGTASHYMPLAFPAVADLDVVDCLRQACGERGIGYHVGLSHSKDSFYGEMEPERMPLADALKSRWNAWVKGGVMCSEMEAAALFVLCSVLRKRAGGIMVAVNAGHPGLENLCETAVLGLRKLIARDRQ
ncbi:MAG: nucleoside phosphorylase [Ardenticatenaceae bacterium]|nr:nucleoside phosphorylase [Anaerolineales bacterium]MCB8937299.1 nucleoside phosphorylase [Ardenticatenaceae bacterium]MCB8975507.1 nucleoside phosphorylase [Ardenticatenaceae bacterium]